MEEIRVVVEGLKQGGGLRSSSQELQVLPSPRRDLRQPIVELLESKEFLAMQQTVRELRQIRVEDLLAVRLEVEAAKARAEDVAQQLTESKARAEDVAQQL